MFSGFSHGGMAQDGLHRCNTPKKTARHGQQRAHTYQEDAPAAAAAAAPEAAPAASAEAGAAAGAAAAEEAQEMRRVEAVAAVEAEHLERVAQTGGTVLFPSLQLRRFDADGGLLLLEYLLLEHVNATQRYLLAAWHLNDGVLDSGGEEGRVGDVLEALRANALELSGVLSAGETRPERRLAREVPDSAGAVLNVEGLLWEHTLLAKEAVDTALAVGLPDPDASAAQRAAEPFGQVLAALAANGEQIARRLGASTRVPESAILAQWRHHLKCTKAYIEAFVEDLESGKGRAGSDAGAQPFDHAEVRNAANDCMKQGREMAAALAAGDPALEGSGVRRSVAEWAGNAA